MNEDNEKVKLSGYLYVLINESMEGIVKIGYTTRSPRLRASELSSPTGVPTPFISVYTKEFKDVESAEDHVHSILEIQGLRVSNNREFFKTSVDNAIDTIEYVKRIEDNKLLPKDDKKMSKVDLLITQGQIILDEEENPRKAAKKFQEAGALNSPYAYYLLGSLYMNEEYRNTNDLEKAYDAFNNVIRLEKSQNIKEYTYKSIKYQTQCIEKLVEEERNNYKVRFYDFDISLKSKATWLLFYEQLDINNITHDDYKGIRKSVELFLSDTKYYESDRKAVEIVALPFINHIVKYLKMYFEEYGPMFDTVRGYFYLAEVYDLRQYDRVPIFKILDVGELNEEQSYLNIQVKDEALLVDDTISFMETIDISTLPNIYTIDKIKKDNQSYDEKIDRVYKNEVATIVLSNKLSPEDFELAKNNPKSLYVVGNLHKLPFKDGPVIIHDFDGDYEIHNDGSIDKINLLVDSNLKPHVNIIAKDGAKLSIESFRKIENLNEDIYYNHNNNSSDTGCSCGCLVTILLFLSFLLLTLL